MSNSIFTKGAYPLNYPLPSSPPICNVTKRESLEYDLCNLPESRNT